MYNKDTVYTIGKILRSGIISLSDAENRNGVYEKVENICKFIYNGETITDFKDAVFKMFLAYGTIAKVRDSLGGKSEILTDILFYDTCSDFEITLYAKLCYALSGTKFKEFLFWQVDKMIEAGDFIDIKKEYAAWRISLFHNEEEAITETEEAFSEYQKCLKERIERDL